MSHHIYQQGLAILHVCSYYTGSKVYKNLFCSIARHEKIATQDVFVPLRQPTPSAEEEHNHAFHIHYAHCLSFLTRLSLSFKQRCLSKAFSKFSDTTQHKRYDLIHAHTLYSDGIFAWRLSKSLGIPYVVTVRTTDVSIFHKLAPHWRAIIQSVLKHAQDVIFLSHPHQEITLARYPCIEPNSHVVPNGIDPFWIENARRYKAAEDTHASTALYVGKIDKNKNIKNSIEAFFTARLDNDNRKFNIIGGSYEDYKAIYGPLSDRLSKNVCFLGSITDKDILRKHFVEANIFIMPSHMETFGLVYLESISQCTPVIYSKGQGIDGLFEESTIGHSCDPNSIKSIRLAIEKTLHKYPKGLIFDQPNVVRNFSWPDIGASIVNGSYLV